MDCIYPLKESKATLPLEYWAFDSETNGLGGEPLLICAISNKGEYKHWKGDKCSEEFINWIQTHKKRLRGTHWFAHNLKFDIGKIFGQILGKEDWSYLMAGSRLITAKYILRHRERGNEQITFLDTFNLWVASLSSIGESLGFAKGITPKKFINGTCKPDNITDKDIDYCFRDCEIVLKILEYYGAFLSQFGVKLRPTIASNAKAVWNRVTIDKKYWINDLEDEKFRTAYYGGRTEVFISRKETKTVYHYDLNSEYPSVMKNNVFPNPDKLRTFDNPKNFLKHINEVEGCADCTVTAPNDLNMPVLPVRHNNQLIFPLGTFKGVWCLPELRLALKMGYTINKVHSITVSKPMNSPFNKYISIFEDMKVEAVRKGDKALKELSKRFMNALSGKFGQRVPLENQLYLDTPEQIPAGVAFTIQNGHYVTKPAGVVRSRGTAVCLIAYVTSYARVLLYTGFGDDTLYCDTDSVFKYSKLPDNIVDDAKFGFWALEHVLFESYFVDPKKYAIRAAKGDKMVTIKGVSTENVNKVVKNVCDLDVDNLTIDHAPPIQFKTAFRLGIKPMSVIHGEKTLIRHHLPKRTFDENGDSTPFILSLEESETETL